jgi:hypothetical protein
MATIFLAYVAFIPTVRASIPSVAYATFTDYTVYAYLLATLTALGDNVMGRFEMNTIHTWWLFFMITCGLIFLPMIASIYFWILY